jgi:hypothetical protein
LLKARNQFPAQSLGKESMPNQQHLNTSNLELDELPWVQLLDPVAKALGRIVSAPLRQLGAVKIAFSPSNGVMWQIPISRIY